MQLCRLSSLRKIVFCILGAAVAPGVYAAQWTSSAGVAPEVTYTDNVCLDSIEEQGEWIGLLTPDVEISGDGNLANFYLAAAVEMNTLSDSRLEDLGCTPTGFGNRDQFSPMLDAGADAVLVKDWLFIDATAAIDQNLVSPFLIGGDSLDRAGNTNTTYRYVVSPYIERRLRNSAVLDLRYTWDEQRNSEDIVGDSESQNVIFKLGSAPGASDVSWGLQADYDRVDYEASAGRVANESELKSARVILGYQLNRQWQINAYYGEEKNDFVSVSDEIDGDFWDVGMRWTPNIRTTVEIGTGDRFFGTTPRIEIDHRYKRSVFSASYKKDLTYDRTLRTLDDPTLGAPQGSTTISESPILDERFTVEYAYTGRRLGLQISASHSDQTRAQDGRDSTLSSARIAVNRNLSSNMKLLVSVSWDETDPRESGSEFLSHSETWRATLGAQRKLSESLSLFLDYKYTDRQSEGIAQEYQENRIALGLKFKL